MLLIGETFLECYYDYFYLQLLNPTEAFFDSKSYVTKYIELQFNAYSKLFIYKLKEYGAYLALLKIIPITLLCLMSKVTKMI